MIPIPNVLKANLTPILGGLLALSVIANLFLWNSLHNAWGREGGLEVALQTQIGETVELKTANDQLVGTITELTASKQALIDKMKADQEQADREIKARDEAVLAANKQALEERRKRNELTKNPTCRAFLDGVVGDFCPEYAQRLLERTRNAPGRLRDDHD